MDASSPDPLRHHRLSHAPPPEEWELREAVEAGDVAAIRALLARGANVEAQDAMGRTPLHTAVISGHEDVVTLLCDRGANVEATDVNGLSPLRWAASNGRVRLAALLLHHGAHHAAHPEVSAPHIAAIEPREPRRPRERLQECGPRSWCVRFSQLPALLGELAKKHGHGSLEQLKQSVATPPTG